MGKVKNVARPGLIVAYIFLIISSFLSIFPFIWIVIGTTNTSSAIIRGKLSFGSELVNNFSKLFNDFNMSTALGNSAKIALITVFFSLLICSMAGYGFQMFKSKGKEKLYGVFLVTMMVPFASLMIPLFQLVSVLNIINSPWSVILVSSASVFIVFFFRQSFVNYPTEILQAARVDGASEVQIFIRVFIPSMKSTYSAAAIYIFMTSWNNYLWPLIVLQTKDQQTTTLLISSMSSGYVPDYGVIMTGIALTTLPVVFFFFVFQKQFVKGMLGSVKQ
ncbi:MAG: carbohydrate ABC transporter permease [Sphaerochaetaceae bacterium]|nr:carbohydrate ABC transporter permease [Sphaerochaetaceae bacterium]